MFKERHFKNKSYRNSTKNFFKKLNRNFLKIFSVFIFIFFYSFEASADIKILEWNETSNLTSYGRLTKFVIKIQAINIPPNSGIKSFSITNSGNKKTEVSSMTLNSMAVKFLNQGNSLDIFFDKPLLNNQSAFIQFEMKDYYDKINKFLRQEPFYIPSFASGAIANIDFNLGIDYELISSHKNLTTKNNRIIFNGVVPEGGIKEILKLTNSSSIWDVDLRSKIILNNSDGLMEITVPYLFRGGAQKVENQTIGASLSPSKHTTTRENDVITFAIKPNYKEVIIFNKAKIYTGKNFRIENNRSPDKFLEVSSTEEALLRPILQKIIYDPKYDFMPLHAKIVNFVNQYLTYDLKYYGKLLGVEEILKTRSGVCSEYATLFNALARVAKIPSSVVHGYAMGESNKFESHAWNMIYVDNRWLHVDPTWNLSTGIVSSSHIYIKDNRKEEIIIKYQGKETNIQINRDFNIKEVPM